jgi:hypothetical protein
MNVVNAVVAPILNIANAGRNIASNHIPRAVMSECPADKRSQFPRKSWESSLQRPKATRAEPIAKCRLYMVSGLIGDAA